MAKPKVLLGTLESGTRFRYGEATYVVCLDKLETASLQGKKGKVMVTQPDVIDPFFMSALLRVEVLPC